MGIKFQITGPAAQDFTFLRGCFPLDFTQLSESLTEPRWQAEGEDAGSAVSLKDVLLSQGGGVVGLFGLHQASAERWRRCLAEELVRTGRSKELRNLPEHVVDLSDWPMEGERDLPGDHGIMRRLADRCGLQGIADDLLRKTIVHSARIAFLFDLTDQPQEQRTELCRKIECLASELAAAGSGNHLVIVLMANRRRFDGDVVQPYLARVSAWLRTDAEVPDAASRDPAAESYNVEPRDPSDTFVPRTWIKNWLEERLSKADRGMLVIHGEANSGKSHVISQLEHFFGNRETALVARGFHDPSAQEPARLTATLYRGLLAEFGWDGDFPQDDMRDPSAGRERLTALLRAGSHSGNSLRRCMVAVDALDEAADPETAWTWLPESLPRDVYLILTMRGKRPGILPPEARDRSCWIDLSEEAHTDDVSRDVQEYVDAAGIPPEVGKSIIQLHRRNLGEAAFACQAVKDRIEEQYSTEQLLEYLSRHPGIGDLYADFWTRLERRIRQAGGDTKSLLRTAALLTVAAAPLHKLIIARVLRPDDGGAALSLVLEELCRQHLVRDRADRYELYSPCFTRWVRKTKVLDGRAQHGFLADFCCNCWDANNGDLRGYALRHAPYHLTAIDDWQQLYDLLRNLKFFKAAWYIDECEMLAAWSTLEDHSSLRMVDAYECILSDPAWHDALQYVWPIAFLLDSAGHLEQSLSLRNHLVNHYRECGDIEKLHAALCNLGNTLRKLGQPNAAMAFLEEAESICRTLEDRHGLWKVLTNQATILKLGGDLDAALDREKEVESICKQLEDKRGLANCLDGQGLILQHRGKLKLAIKLHEEAECLSRDLGDAESLQSILGNHALALKDDGDLDGAKGLLEEQEYICRRLGLKGALSNCLGNQALICRSRGQLDMATKLLGKQELICRDQRRKHGLANCLINQAVLMGLNEMDAMKLCEEAEHICREINYSLGLAVTKHNQACILEQRGALKAAMEFHKEAEGMFRELGERHRLADSLAVQALILERCGKLDVAIKLHKEEERICRELGNKDGLRISLGNQASILQGRGDLDEAMELHKEEERICRELDNKNGLRISLGNQALILAERGELDAAMELHKEEERICRELGNKNGLRISLGNQALILAERGELDAAMKLRKEEERICKELGNKNRLSISLINQAEIFEDLGELDEGLLLAERAHRLTISHDFRALQEKIEAALNRIRSKLI